MNKVNLKKMDVYIYIDASNIKNALKVSKIELDFKKLYEYFAKTYSNIKAIKYFEGIDKSNEEKIESFIQLEKYGYKMMTLERKSYENKAKFKTVKCENCNEKIKVEILKKSNVLKSNVDVYLCTEFMTDLLLSQESTHAIILSCDGDYAEMIKSTLHQKNNIYVSMFTTPFTKYNNYLSIRLKQLESIERFFLVNILNIKDKISTQIEEKEKK